MNGNGYGQQFASQPHRTKHITLDFQLGLGYVMC